VVIFSRLKVFATLVPWDEDEQFFYNFHNKKKKFKLQDVLNEFKICSWIKTIIWNVFKFFLNSNFQLISN
jgi:hypothetical protein